MNVAIPMICFTVRSCLALVAAVRPRVSMIDDLYWTVIGELPLPIGVRSGVGRLRVARMVPYGGSFSHLRRCYPVVTASKLAGGETGQRDQLSRLDRRRYP